MNEHMLSGASAYIKDFTEWYLKNENPPDIRVFVNDRFSECSESKKRELYEIFVKLSTIISNGDTCNQDTIDIANSLVKIL
ncbi:MAG: hypothetical protein K0R72_884 [Clostridia bacterium]|jgi:hypothetical protein|nr:hypothetical protein [Clostridia bacterium]